MAKRTRVFVYEPVLFDRMNTHANSPEAGARVVKTQPFGCPKNGTMGMTYVNDADTGDFHGLVMLTSLRATNEYVVPRDRAAEAREARSRAIRGER